ncbi:DAK2 domain-containing protein [Paraburkholderia strydomiana]|uniref:DAK2 domain-containing protein n=1 Tax=Paraburkholderia strydomiana TaxID=1245417 RepID=UPI001BECC301|nr:DAK2 domain-containing protein [Paraburkholderia strydomiana]MBT2792750.1 DAK2 domain-containing protein [Paraburkholderia strydomiana]
MTVSNNELRELLTRALNALPAHADGLRELDAALGDGDLGITVRAGSAAVVKALAALPDNASLSDALLAAGKAFSTANPSTFAALVGGGPLVAAKAVTGAQGGGHAEALAIGRAVAGRIVERGKSQLGDKTVLDALLPSVDAMIATAQEGVIATASIQSRKGRAAWVQERSIGHSKPGATAYARFLQALRGAFAA